MEHIGGKKLDSRESEKERSVQCPRCGIEKPMRDLRIYASRLSDAMEALGLA